MRGLSIISFMLALGNFCTAQSAEDFEQAGKNLFLHLTASEEGVFVPLLRVGQYRELIERQPWDEEKKLKRIHQIDQSYSILYVQWQEAVRKLQKDYASALRDGAELQYMRTHYFEGTGLSETYDVETSFIFRTANMQSEVVLKYQLGWVPEYGLHLMSAVEESF